MTYTRCQQSLPSDCKTSIVATSMKSKWYATCGCSCGPPYSTGSPSWRVANSSWPERLNVVGPRKNIGLWVCVDSHEVTIDLLLGKSSRSIRHQLDATVSVETMGSRQHTGATMSWQAYDLMMDRVTVSYTSFLSRNGSNLFSGKNHRSLFIQTGKQGRRVFFRLGFSTAIQLFIQGIWLSNGISGGGTTRGCPLFNTSSERVMHFISESFLFWAVFVTAVVVM